jgi:hypothetical protein
MNAATVSKSSRKNMLEGIMLLAVFQAFPQLTMAALLIKLVGHNDLVTQPGGAAIFVVIASVCYAATVAFVAPKFPQFFKPLYQPWFFDAGLSVNEKILRWRSQPERSPQLVALVLMLSMLVVTSVG